MKDGTIRPVIYILHTQNRIPVHILFNYLIAIIGRSNELVVKIYCKVFDLGSVLTKQWNYLLSTILRSLSLSFCFLLVGEDLSVIPQHLQNFPIWEK